MVWRASGVRGTYGYALYRFYPIAPPRERLTCGPRAVRPAACVMLGP